MCCRQSSKAIEIPGEIADGTHRCDSVPNVLCAVLCVIASLWEVLSYQKRVFCLHAAYPESLTPNRHGCGCKPQVMHKYGAIEGCGQAHALLRRAIGCTCAKSAHFI